MSGPKRERTSPGEVIRRIREQKAFSREDLADKAKVWLSTLRDIELGKRMPRYQTVRKIAAALGVPAEMLFPTQSARGALSDESEGPGLSMTAARFIPVFAGGDTEIDPDDLAHFREHWLQEIFVHRFDDGFAVIEVVEQLSFPNVVEMLRHRRQRHLSIINQVPEFLYQPDGASADPWFCQSNKIEYVMSVYRISPNAALDEALLLAMCEPSLIGITDDPDEPEESDYDFEDLETNIAAAEGAIETIKFKNVSCFVSWSNVLVLDGDERSSAFEAIRKIQVQLQKLWFQVYVYGAAVDARMHGLTGCVPENVKNDILAVALEFHNFCRIRSVGAWHINRLKTALIETSRIREICEDLKQKADLLKRFE